MALTNRELAVRMAQRLRAYRVTQGLNQRDLATRSGISTTSLSRFERTGAITLNNLIALLRALGLANRIDELIPDNQGPSPIELLEASKRDAPPVIAPRARARVSRR